MSLGFLVVIEVVSNVMKNPLGTMLAHPWECRPYPNLYGPLLLVNQSQAHEGQWCSIHL